MLKLRYLSVLISQRLTLAAQEIFKDVEETIVELHDETKLVKLENAKLKLKLREFGINLYNGMLFRTMPLACGLHYKSILCDILVSVSTLSLSCRVMFVFAGLLTSSVVLQTQAHLQTVDEVWGRCRASLHQHYCEDVPVGFANHFFLCVAYLLY